MRRRNFLALGSASLAMARTRTRSHSRIDSCKCTFLPQSGPLGFEAFADIHSGLEGFHYFSIVVDAAVIADTATRRFFGSGWDNSGIEIPAHDAGFYVPKEVPHGDVRERWYFRR